MRHSVVSAGMVEQFMPEKLSRRRCTPARECTNVTGEKSSSVYMSRPLIAHVGIIGRECPVHAPSSRRRNAASGPAWSAVRTCPGDDPCGRCAPSSWQDADVQVTTWPVKAAADLAGVRTMPRPATRRTALKRISPVFLQRTSTSLFTVLAVAVSTSLAKDNLTL